MDETEELKCEDCETTEGAVLTTCPFAEEIHDERKEVVLCPECRHQRAQDI